MRSKERTDQHIKCDQSYMDPEAFVNESASVISVSPAPDSLDLFSNGGFAIRYTKTA